MTNADILDALQRDVAAEAAELPACTCEPKWPRLVCQVRLSCERWKAQLRWAEARARIAALDGPKLLAVLIGRLPINGRGECFMCSLGNEPDEEMRHYDHINNEAESYCLQSEIYDEARTAIADAGKALEVPGA